MTILPVSLSNKSILDTLDTLEYNLILNSTKVHFWQI